MELIYVRCPICGKIFVKDNVNKRYCSQDCYTEHKARLQHLHYVIKSSSDEGKVAEARRELADELDYESKMESQEQLRRDKRYGTENMRRIAEICGDSVEYGKIVVEMERNYAKNN